MIGTMPGSTANAEEPATEAESILTGNYEKQHREVRNPVYREAATSFAGGDGSEESPYGQTPQRSCSTCRICFLMRRTGAASTGTSIIS